MDHYRAYKWAAVGFLVVFAGFVGAVAYWSEPATVEAVVEPSAPVAAPGGRVAPAAEVLAGGANVDIQPLLSSENELFLQGMIEQFSTRPAVGSAATVSVASIASATNEPIVVASSAPSASSGTDAGASSASGGSTSGGAGSTSTAGNTPPRTTSGGNGAAARQEPKKLFMFAGMRSQAHFRMLEYAELRPLFAPDFVWTVSSFRSEEDFSRMMRLLRQYNPETTIGYYFSACTIYEPDRGRIPDRLMTVPPSQVPNEWLIRDKNGRRITWPNQENRFVLDLRKEEVRQAIISLAITLAKHYGYDALSFDNCYWGYGMPVGAGSSTVVSAKDWTEAFMKFYEEAGKAARENELKCIVNVAARANDIPAAFEAISPFVDGIMTEMPFHENIVKAGLAQRELAAYAKVAKEGTSVYLLQVYEGRGLETMRLARPLLNSHDNVYLEIVDFGRHYWYHGTRDWDMRKAPPIGSWYRMP